MKVQDVIHHYLGCEVKDLYFNDTKTLHYVECGGEAVGLKSKNGIVHKRTMVGIKPILRRLDSMAQDEAIELAALSVYEPDFTNVQIARNKYNDLIVSWGGIEEPERTSFNCTGELFYSAEQFHFLTSRRFWLFGDEAFDNGEVLDLKGVI